MAVVAPSAFVVPVCTAPVAVLRAVTVAKATGFPFTSTAFTGMTVGVFTQPSSTRPPSGRYAELPQAAKTRKPNAARRIPCLPFSAEETASQGRPLVRAIIPRRVQPGLVGGLLLLGGAVDAREVH